MPDKFAHLNGLVMPRVERTTQFVFEPIGGENSTPVLFIVCTDGSRSLANLDDIKAAKQQGRCEGAEMERAKWVELLKEHKLHCSTKGQQHLTEVKNGVIGKHLLKWKLLFETLAAAVREEVPFPGETADGRCPKCDEAIPCAYCIAAVEPMEAQEQILASIKGEGKE